MICIEEARRHYDEADTAHGFDHVLRVLRLAERIGAAENVDLNVVRAATLLHDVGRPDEQRTGESHALISARRAREILAGEPEEWVERVARAISEHRFRGAARPTSREGQVLFDADKLDAIGAVGVARAYAVAGAHQQRLWAQLDAVASAIRLPDGGLGDMGDDHHTPLHEYLFKLVHLRDQLYTSEARRIAERRHRFMAAFFDELGAEVSGEA